MKHFLISLPLSVVLPLLLQFQLKVKFAAASVIAIVSAELSRLFYINSWLNRSTWPEELLSYR